jgi:predicted MFS family arabinose efflux permease
LGASISGVIGDLLSWRGVFAVFGLFGLAVTIAAFLKVRGIEKPKAAPYRVSSVIAGFRSVFADPRAKVCFGSVFLEGVFIQGVFPYIAVLLAATGETRASIAGLVLAGFGAGGLIYSLCVSALVARIPQRVLMILGGVSGACMLTLIALDLPWYLQCGVFVMLGFGFYLLHGSIHVHVTDLSHTARGAATSLHSSTFYLGQAMGPLFYGFTFAHGVGAPSIVAGGMVVLGVGITCSRLLKHKLGGAPAGH